MTLCYWGWCAIKFNVPLRAEPMINVVSFAVREIYGGTLTAIFEAFDSLRTLIIDVQYNKILFLVRSALKHVRASAAQTHVTLLRKVHYRY